MFGFDPKGFSDEELQERVAELNRRITWSYRTGNQAIADQLLAQKIQIEREQRERMFNATVGHRIAQSHPVVVESDPDLASALKQQKEDAQAKASPQVRARPKPFSITKERVRPTNNPTIEDDSEPL